MTGPAINAERLLNRVVAFAKIGARLPAATPSVEQSALPRL